MDVLDKLTADQKALIVSLPYRVGLWVSHSDDAGGDEADEKELTALANILQGFSEQVFGSELLQYIMNETVSRKHDWPEWKKQIQDVPKDCGQALDALREYVDEKEVNAYVMRLMEIGEAVALAFREYEQQSGLDKLRIYSSYILTTLKARLRQQPSKTFNQYLNVSIKERKALRALAIALETTYSA